MMRIHFSQADLARVRVAPGPDPMWEAVLSLHRFQTRRGRAAVLRWYDDARAVLPQRGLVETVRSILIPIAPHALYLPDFLTPDAGEHGLDAGLDAIAATPRARLRYELGRVAEGGQLPTWGRALADGDRQSRAELLGGLRSYHDAVLEPYWDDIQADVDADRIRRSRAIMDGGIEGLLGSFEPMMHWKPPVLHVDYPTDRDLSLNGRGLKLLPSYFCWLRPIALADPELPPVLVYPLHNGARRPRRGAHPRGSPGTGAMLAALLGNTRAAALEVIALGATTTELAGQLGISPAAASHHIRILREAGLILSTRDRQHVLHTITPSGADLLRHTGGG
ncbi:transcriptional regulator [Marinitenerispora sediminis]|uniref:Transcriptional regulator n=2 Tax=Marinitenerispora sediminis TaxID=1931232 RepID=A0A368SY99_9ACTN|nr:transcriptional regulator [Marinitenerispora sediminis]RCV57817.1 transcriptional regulator [Marinitenerispora sediminis]RCV59557.1 transcriptional regulator [Marinitenerispora sediminis]